MRRTVAWLSGALCLWCGVAGGAELTKDEYTRLVGQAADGLKQAAAAPEGRQKRAAAAVDLLPEEADISVAPGAPTVSADNQELRAALRRWVTSGPEGMREAAALLENLHQGLAVTTAPRPAEAEAVLTDVLSQREFHPGLASRLRAWLYDLALRLLVWIQEQFPDLDLGLAGKVARVLGWILVAVVAVLVFYLLARVLGLFVSMPRRSDQVAPASPGLAQRTTQAEWLAEVEAALAAGDYLSALRALHMAALLRLDEVGIVTFNRATTDGHFIRQLRQKGREPEAEALAGLNRSFAWAWYGGRATGPREYAAAHAQWRELEALTTP